MCTLPDQAFSLFHKLGAVLVAVLLGWGLTAPAQAQSPVILESPNDGDSFGVAVAGIGDLTGDGTSDILVGAPGESTSGGFSRDGRVYLIDGSDGSVLETLTAPSGDGFGHSVAGARAPDGSPFAIVAAATRDFETDVLKTELIQLIDPSDASVVQTFPTPVARGDYDVASAGDIDGDGVLDVLVGSPADTVDGAAGAGRAYVLSGGDASTLLTLTSPNPDEDGQFGTSVAGGTDVTGDGTPDLMIGAPAEDRDNDGSGFDGRVYLVDGSDGSMVRTLVSSRDASVGNSTFGASVANVSDINGDGTPDIIVGASSEDVFANGTRVLGAGRVHLISGADGTILRTLTAPEGDSFYLGRAVAEVGDVNFDGTSDVIAGAPGPPPPAFSSTEGPVFVFSGADGTVLDTLSKPTDREDIDFGLEIDGAGDVDGDGAPDVIVGVPSGVLDDLEGRAYLFSGSDLFLTATFSRTVSSSGAADFDTTGVRINFSGVTGSGRVTVERFGIGPKDPSGIPEGNVSSYRIVAKAEEGLGFNAAEMRLGVGGLDGIEDPSNVTIYRRPNPGSGSFSALDTRVDTNGTPDDVSDDTLSATTDSLSEFVLGSDTEPLPVELARFEGQSDGKRVVLRWQTASETNNAGFAVQRRVASAPGARKIEAGTFRKIGFVKGRGTTTQPQSYRFADTDLPYAANSLVYRLKQVDADGSSSLSEAITVSRRGPDRVRLLGTFPNPAHGQTTVRYGLPHREEVTVRVYDVLGRRVATVERERSEAGRQQLQLDTSDFPSGTYFLRLTAGQTTRTQQFVVVQ